MTKLIEKDTTDNFFSISGGCIINKKEFGVI